MKLSHFYILLLALNLGGFPLVAGMATYMGTDSKIYSISIRSAILGVSLLLIILAVAGNKIKFVRGLIWAPLLIFWLAYLWRIYVDTYLDPASLARNVLDYWVWAVGACLVPMLALLTHPPNDYFARSYKPCFFMVVMGSVFVAFLGTGWLESDDGLGYDSGRLRLKSLNPISVGHLGLSLLLLSIWPFISSGKALGGYRQIMNVGAGLLGSYLLVASASRGPIAALLIVLLFYFLAQDFKRNWKILVVVALLFIGVVQLGVYFEEAGAYQVLSRLESVFSGKDVAVSERQIAYTGAIDQFLQSPILGESLEERITGFYPHNVILESFMATGLIGGLSFLFLIFHGVYISFRIMRMKSEYGWISLLFMQYLIAAQFSGALYASTTMWTFWAVNIALYYKLRLGFARREVWRMAGAHA